MLFIFVYGCFRKLIKCIIIVISFAMCPIWTKEEQEFLKQQVDNEVDKPINWNSIATKMNNKFQGSNYSGKQCREKYTNKAQFSKSDQSMQKWSEEQAVNLIDKVAQLGSRWSKIKQYFHNKSENSLKNKFYGELRKLIRNINKIGKENIKGFSKTIKYGSLIRVMQGSQGVLNFKGELKDQCERLRNQILKMLKEKVETEQILEFIKQIHQFNMVTRCYCAKKPKKIKEEHQPSKEFQNSEQIRMRDRLQMIGHTSQPIKLIRERINSFEFFSDEKQGRRIHSQDDHGADLEEEVSNILGYEYTPMGFSYFEQK